MALLKTRIYSYKKNDVGISFTFTEDDQLARRLSDFLDLLKEAQAEVEAEIAPTRDEAPGAGSSIVTPIARRRANAKPALPPA